MVTSEEALNKQSHQLKERNLQQKTFKILSVIIYKLAV
jgi:hypothetical protein